MIQSISWRQSLTLTSWHEEYSEGMTMELYNFQVHRDYVGYLFHDFVRVVKQEANACVVAIACIDLLLSHANRKKSLAQQQVKRTRRKSFLTNNAAETVSTITFNPGADYRIKSGDILFAFADEAKALDKFETTDTLNKELHHPTWNGLGKRQQVSPDFVIPERGTDPNTFVARSDSVASEEQNDGAPTVGEESDPLAALKRTNSLSRLPKKVPPKITELDGEIELAAAALLGKLKAIYPSVSDEVSRNVRLFLLEQVNLGVQDPFSVPTERSLSSNIVHEIDGSVGNHVIVVTSNMDDMQYLLKPLYTSLHDCSQVVFLTEQLPNAREWYEVNLYHRVWVMQKYTMSGYSYVDLLLRAGIMRARAVLFCADLEKLSRSRHLADSSVMQGVITANSLKLNRAQTILISELTQGGFPMNANDVTASAEDLYHMDDHSIMLSRDEVEKEAFNIRNGFQHLDSSYVAGCTVITVLLDLVMCQQYFNPYIMSILNGILLGRGAENCKHDAVVMLIQVPHEHADGTFGEFFHKHLAETGAIVIGLYRLSQEYSKQVRCFLILLAS
eukprot:764706-Hanusia_phi.AAC.4